jgi:hypothetical protein
MITEYFDRKSHWATQRIFARAQFWATEGEFYWMQDVDGTFYLARVGENDEVELLGV